MPVDHDHHNDPHALAQALDQLREKGHKSTKIRRSLIEILLRDHGPFSIEDLQSRVSEDCDIATVYRNMSLFEGLSLVQHVEFGDGLARYEWSGAGHEHHHHIICQRCHRVEELEYCFVRELEKLVRDRGYTEVSHRMEFYGICQTCQAAEADPT